MGGNEPWMETDQEYMEREYRMRSIESIVGDDGICDEEIPGIIAMSDKLVNYVMTGDHRLPASDDKQPGHSLKELTKPHKKTAFMGDPVSRLSVPLTVEEEPRKRMADDAMPSVETP
jgi:hypothetical protein